MTMPKSQNAKLPGNVNELTLDLLFIVVVVEAAAAAAVGVAVFCVVCSLLF